jgi:glycosyltransferase involved in cell wall biosynthesis
VQFLVFSDDWGEHPSSCQHLFRILAARHPTIWVNTVGLRRPQLTLDDARRSLRKISGMLGLRRGGAPGARANGGHAGGGPANRNGAKGGAGPTVRIPLMTPFHSPAWLAAWNRRSLLSNVRRALAESHFDRYAVVTTTPSVCDVVGQLAEGKVIYYCVDDFSEWPGMEKPLIERMERKLLDSVSLVICTSAALYERFQRTHPTYLLTHGVDATLFTAPPAREHPALAAVPRPRVGYFGSFDQRSDVELLRSVALALPEVSFVVTGPVQGRFPALKSLPNFHFTGPVPYRELPEVVGGWRACLLPYRVNNLTVNINPLKLKEYLASGLPVVATPLPEVEALGRHLRVAATVEEWCRAITEAVSGEWQPDRDAVRELLRYESWQSKAELFLRICQVA